MSKKYEEIKYVNWGALTGQQIKMLSVAEITKPSSKDQIEDGVGTVNDPRLGCQKDRTPCSTCQKYNLECNGHMGHINLPFPVYNLQYTDVILKVLQAICPHCARPRIKPLHI